jgi:hypothetical protein
VLIVVRLTRGTLAIRCPSASLIPCPSNLHGAGALRYCVHSSPSLLQLLLIQPHLYRLLPCSLLIILRAQPNLFASYRQSFL